MAGKFTLEEIMSQPQAWRAALDELRAREGQLPDLQAGGFEQVVFVGCGSTYYLSLAAASLTQQLTGVSARGVSGSEAWLYPDTVFGPKRTTLLVAVSRSGTTTETVRAVEEFRSRGRGQVVSLTCYPDTPLANAADLAIVLTAGQERSVAQTRAFSVLYLATTFLAHKWAGRSTAPLDDLPAACERLVPQYEQSIASLAQDSSIERIYFLGSGPRYGLACEASLKMKEMTLSHSEPFQVLEFRHGPQSMVTESTLMVGLVGEEHEGLESAVLKEMREKGANVLALGESSGDVVLASGVPSPARNVLYLPLLQRLAFGRAIHKGLDPDKPHNLQAVVKLE